MIKFLNAQCIASIEIHRDLWQVYGHTLLDGQHISCSSSARRCLTINHPIARTCAFSDFHLFLYLKKFLSGQRQSFQNDREAEMSVSVVPIPGGRLLWRKNTNVVPQYDKCLNSGGDMLKNSSTLAVSDPINLYIKLGFCHCKRPQENLLCGCAT